MTIKASYLSTEYIGKPSSYHKYTHIMGLIALPMTDLAKLLFLSVARPRSPILTLPVVPVMKMLSHFRSLRTSMNL